MPCSVTQGSHPDFYILTYTGQLQTKDLQVDDDVHLNEGRKIYLLVDISRMEHRLPDRYVEHIMKCFLVHPNLRFLAGFVSSMPLRVVSNMVVKLTRQQNKVSLHDSYEGAYESVLDAIERYADANIS
jgi:hypothetical protein